MAGMRRVEIPPKIRRPKNTTPSLACSGSGAPGRGPNLRQPLEPNRKIPSFFRFLFRSPAYLLTEVTPRRFCAQQPSFESVHCGRSLP